MELKELILSTLEELDAKIKDDGYIDKKTTLKSKDIILSDEKRFLIDSKERFEVLFDGLNSEANQKVEAKLNLVINFLQFYLSKIDERLEKI